MHPSGGSSAGIPRSYISCTEKAEGDPLLALATRLREQGWVVVDLAAGHFPMRSVPHRLAQLLEEA